MNNDLIELIALRSNFINVGKLMLVYDSPLLTYHFRRMSAARRIADWILVRTLQSIPDNMAQMFRRFYGMESAVSKKTAEWYNEAYEKLKRYPKLTFAERRHYHAYYRHIYYRNAEITRKIMDAAKKNRTEDPNNRTNKLYTCSDGCWTNRDWRVNDETRDPKYWELCDNCKKYSFNFEHIKLHENTISSMGAIITNVYVNSRQPIGKLVDAHLTVNGNPIHRFTKAHLVSDKTNERENRYTYELGPRPYFSACNGIAVTHIICLSDTYASFEYSVDQIFIANGAIFSEIISSIMTQHVPKSLILYNDGTCCYRFIRLRDSDAEFRKKPQNGRSELTWD